jgi:hypothetical protein
MQGTADIFWSREPITGPKGTKEKPAIVPSFNDHRVVGLEIEQVRGVPLFRLRVRLRMRALHQLLHAFLRQNHRRAALTTRPSVACRASSGSGWRRGRCTSSRGSTSSARACPPHAADEHTPPCLASHGQTIGRCNSRGEFAPRRLQRMEGGEH